MNTSTDELPMPHYEDRLWAEICAQHAQGAWTPPTVAGRATAPTLARPNVHRRTVRRSLAAAAVLAVIAVAAALSPLGSTPSRSPGTPEQPPTGTVPEELETLTIAAIDDALADSIVHTAVDNTSTGDAETWYDEITGAERHITSKDDDTTLFDVGFAAAPGPDDGPSTTAMIREVDYCFSEYSDTEQPWLPPVPKAREIRDQLDDGTLVASGTEIVDGRELIRLLHSVPEGFPADTDAAVYVDPDSYRPVLQRTYPDTPEATTVTFEYLPRTPEGLALLVPPVPADFAPAEGPRNKPEHESAGCLGS